METYLNLSKRMLSRGHLRETQGLMIQGLAIILAPPIARSTNKKPSKTTSLEKRWSKLLETQDTKRISQAMAWAVQILSILLKSWWKGRRHCLRQWESILKQVRYCKIQRGKTHQRTIEALSRGKLRITHNLWKLVDLRKQFTHSLCTRMQKEN